MSISRPDNHRERPDAHRTNITVEEVCALLDSITNHRHALAEHTATLDDWYAHSRDFALAWREFIASGGINAADFVAFMDGEFAPRRTRRRRHLRLVSN